MRSLPLIRLCSAIAAASCGLLPAALARSSEWKDAKGNLFEADPVEVIGPIAFFSNGTLLPLSLLSPEDCIRFFQGMKGPPVRAAEWSQGKSPITEDLIGRSLKYDGDHLVADDLKGRPEPEFYMVFYTTNSKSAAWDMMGKSTPDLFAKLQSDYPGMVQGVMFGVDEARSEHVFMATSMKGNWLVTDFREQVEMDHIRRMTPTSSYGILVMTRNGLAVFGPDAINEIQVKAIFAKFTGLLALVQPDNPRGWKDRAHFWRAVQPVAYAKGKSDPVLLGNPLVAARLRQLKIYQVDATFHVAADATITAVEVKPDGMPAGMVTMLSEGFRKVAVFVPAVDHGRFVDGVYAYHMEVPH
jgi:hypothetical protein